MSSHKSVTSTMDVSSFLIDYDSRQLGVFESALFMVVMVFCLSGCVPAQKPEQGVGLEQSSIDNVAVDSSQRDSVSIRVDPSPINVNIIGNARSESFVKNAMIEVADVYQQCGLPLSIQVNSEPEEITDDLPEDKLYFLSQKHAPFPPTVYVIGSTLERDVAFSYLPSIKRDVSGTAWITDRVSDACFAWVVAHEIGHIALDSSLHHPDRRNVMHRFCSANNNFNRSTSLPRWDDRQCSVLRDYFAIDR